MTPTQIGLMIAAALGLIVVAAIIMQGIENQRRQKRLRVLALKDQVRRVDHLFNALPTALRTNDMDTLLLRCLEQHWQEIAALDPAAGAKAQLNRIQQLKMQTRTGPETATGLTLFPDRDQARNARAMMRELAQFLTDLAKSGRFNIAQIQPIMNQVKIAYARARLDLELMDAQQIEQTRGATVALHQYRSCIKSIQKLSNYAQMQGQLARVEALLEQAELQAQAVREKQQEVIAAGDETQAQTTELNKSPPLKNN